MTGAGTQSPLASLFWPGLAAAIAFIFLLGLGVWQIERKGTKEALITTLTQRLSASATPLPPPALWRTLDPAQQEYRRVTFSGEFVTGREALVYTTGSALRPDVTGPGYWVFAPAQTADGVVVVNRGFVPEGRQDPKLRAAADGAGKIDMVGVLRWPEPTRWFTPKGERDRGVWFERDHLAIAAAKGWGEVAPFLIELESPSPPGALPRPAPLKLTLRNDHLQYSLTWFGLAIALAVVFVLWARSRRREENA